MAQYNVVVETWTDDGQELTDFELVDSVGTEKEAIESAKWYLRNVAKPNESVSIEGLLDNGDIEWIDRFRHNG